MNPWPWQHFLSFTPEFNLPSGKRIWPIDCTERLHQSLVPDRTVSEKIHRAAALEADILFLFFRALWFKAMVSKALCTARKSKSQKFSLSAWLSSCGWVCILWLAGVTGGECQQVPLAGEMHTQCPCSALRDSWAAAPQLEQAARELRAVSHRRNGASSLLQGWEWDQQLLLLRLCSQHSWAVLRGRGFSPNLVKPVLSRALESLKVLGCEVSVVRLWKWLTASLCGL